MTDDDLDGFFAAARREAGPLPAGLAARMQADAARVQAEIAAAVPSGGRARPGLWQELRAALGGWAGLGGLATAGVAGVWLGLAPPALLPDPLDLIGGDLAELSLLPGDALALAMMEEN